jgi:hypothetical protein
MAIITFPALIPINYSPSSRCTSRSTRHSDHPVAHRASPPSDGTIARVDTHNQRSNYHGLSHTLRALRMHVVGVTNLVEMDSVRRMLSNPDVQPNAANKHKSGLTKCSHWHLTSCVQHAQQHSEKNSCHRGSRYTVRRVDILAIFRRRTCPQQGVARDHQVPYKRQKTWRTTHRGARSSAPTFPPPFFMHNGRPLGTACPGTNWTRLIKTQLAQAFFLHEEGVFMVALGKIQLLAHFHVGDLITSIHTCCSKPAWLARSTPRQKDVDFTVRSLIGQDHLAWQGYYMSTGICARHSRCCRQPSSVQYRTSWTDPSAKV